MSIVINGVLKRLKADGVAHIEAIKHEANYRFKELKKENTDIPKSFRSHTDFCIFPAIAAYNAMLSYKIESEQAINYISSVFNGYCDIYAHFLRFGIKACHLVHKVPDIMVKSSLKRFAPGKNNELGFQYSFPEKTDKRIARFDITFCPYYKVCLKYHCTEIMRAFCDSDDHKYAHMHKNLVWDRTGTIGKGSSVCDFRLVDISRFPEYKIKTKEAQKTLQ